MTSQTTCWTMIDAAADGGTDEQQQFAKKYEPLIRAYLGARWKNSRLSQEIGDACQDFFIDCFRDGGALDRVERERNGGFRPFLYGIARIIALRWEEKTARRRDRQPGQEFDLGEIQSDETQLSKVIDRSWARLVMHEAGTKHKQKAEVTGTEALQRVDLLRLRFQEGIPIREIAKLWDCEAAKLHHEYAKARDEFSQALYEVVAFHHPHASDADIQRECLELLGALK